MRNKNKNANHRSWETTAFRVHARRTVLGLLLLPILTACKQEARSVQKVVPNKQPIPAWAEGAVLCCLKDNPYSSLSRQADYNLLHIGNGSAEHYFLTRLENGGRVSVSPSRKYVVWTENYKGVHYVGRLISGRRTPDHVKQINESSGYELLSWAPRGESAIMKPLNSHTIADRLVDVAEPSVSVEIPGSNAYGHMLWTRDGRHLVFVHWVPTSWDQPSNVSVLMLHRYDISTSPQGKLQVSPANEIDVVEAGKILGPAFVSAIAVIKKIGPFAQSGYGGVAYTALSPSGSRALVIGSQKVDPDAPWAIENLIGCDAYLCDGAKTRRILSKYLPLRLSGFVWSCDEQWVQTAAGGYEKDNDWIGIRFGDKPPAEEIFYLSKAEQGFALKLVGEP